MDDARLTCTVFLSRRRGDRTAFGTQIDKRMKKSATGRIDCRGQPQGERRDRTFDHANRCGGVWRAPAGSRDVADCCEKEEDDCVGSNGVMGGMPSQLPGMAKAVGGQSKRRRFGRTKKRFHSQ